MRNGNWGGGEAVRIWECCGREWMDYEAFSVELGVCVYPKSSIFGDAMRKAYIEITAFFDILHVRFVSLFYLILLKSIPCQSQRLRISYISSINAVVFP